jgi:hypothetical protein
VLKIIVNSERAEDREGRREGDGMRKGGEDKEGEGDDTEGTGKGSDNTLSIPCIQLIGV